MCTGRGPVVRPVPTGQPHTGGLVEQPNGMDFVNPWLDNTVHLSYAQFLFDNPEQEQLLIQRSAIDFTADFHPLQAQSAQIKQSGGARRQTECEHQRKYLYSENDFVKRLEQASTTCIRQCSHTGELQVYHVSTDMVHPTAPRSANHPQRFLGPGSSTFLDRAANIVELARKQTLGRFLQTRLQISRAPSKTGYIP